MDRTPVWLAVPEEIAVGIARCKTLAKIANHVAQKWPGTDGVFNLLVNKPELVLAEIEVEV